MKYNSEKNVQILISLLKQNNIKKIIISPGTTNIAFVGSIQNDSEFELYSCIDERSAAYMACGLAEESGETVCLSCTGATAHVNYLPGLTEAFYRKIPILAITSTQLISKVGHNVAQILDRSVLPKDCVKHSVTLPVVKDDIDFLDCAYKVNIAINESKRNGGGPVHINLQTEYSRNFDINDLPKVPLIKTIETKDKFPNLHESRRIAIFVSSHKKMDQQLTDYIDDFCEKYNSVVFCDHTSGYYGKYKVLHSLTCCQNTNIMDCPDLLIHMGEITGDYYSLRMHTNEIWRINEDGQIKDPIGKNCNRILLKYVFEMNPKQFFENYLKSNDKPKNIEYFLKCQEKRNLLKTKMPDFEFSNIWVASRIANKIPENSTIHFGILNSLRSWNFFDLPKNVDSFCNVGGFGIDGCVSSLVGSSLSNCKKLNFLIVGDLAFFYDMNILGNKHLKNNIRIILINNGGGTEFKNYDHPGIIFGENTNNYISAGGHFAKKTDCLVKHYAEDLGFLYISAKNKQEFVLNEETFLTSQESIIFEIFTNSTEESNALASITKLA